MPTYSPTTLASQTLPASLAKDRDLLGKQVFMANNSLTLSLWFDMGMGLELQKGRYYLLDSAMASRSSPDIPRNARNSPGTEMLSWRCPQDARGLLKIKGKKTDMHAR